MDNNCNIENKPKNFHGFIRSGYFWKPFLGITLGGLAGFLYYYFIGCSSGSCPITGSPWLSTLFGSFFGLMLVKSPCSRCS